MGMNLTDVSRAIGKKVDSFMDRVVDTGTPMTGQEYRNRLKQDGGFYGHLKGGQKGKHIKGGQGKHGCI